MINKNKIAEVIRKSGKRPSKEALARLDKILEKQIGEIIEKAKRKADFAGRKTIFAEDIDG